jgi:two-component system nitrogen regulation response regulator GlnG
VSKMEQIKAEKDGFDVGADMPRSDHPPPGVSRLITDAIPRLVDELAAAQPGRVHREALELVERPLLSHVLALTGGNQLRAARLLGLNRNTLRKRCRELGLALPRAARGGTSPKPPSL